MSTEVILVHGLYHQPAHMQALENVLEGLGATVHTPLLHRGSLEADTSAVQQAVDACKGKPIVVGHSYGGAVAAGIRRAASFVFTTAHEAFWAAARKTDGDAGGTRALIDVLLLHRSMATEDIIAGITAALTVGAVTADVVAVEARRHEALGGSRLDRPLAEQSRGPERRVVSLTQRRLADPAAVIAGLPADTRPLPSVAAYDQLLRLPDRAAPEAAPTNKKGTGS